MAAAALALRRPARSRRAAPDRRRRRRPALRRPRLPRGRDRRRRAASRSPTAAARCRPSAAASTARTARATGAARSRARGGDANGDATVDDHGPRVQGRQLRDAARSASTSSARTTTDAARAADRPRSSSPAPASAPAPSLASGALGEDAPVEVITVPAAAPRRVAARRRGRHRPRRRGAAVRGRAAPRSPATAISVERDDGLFEVEVRDRAGRHLEVLLDDGSGGRHGRRRGLTQNHHAARPTRVVHRDHDPVEPADARHTPMIGASADGSRVGTDGDERLEAVAPGVLVEQVLRGLAAGGREALGAVGRHVDEVALPRPRAARRRGSRARRRRSCRARAPRRGPRCCRGRRPTSKASRLMSKSNAGSSGGSSSRRRKPGTGVSANGSSARWPASRPGGVDGRGSGS